ncbi:hypothetical protein [Burkholderia sp. TSV86]|uniref:hypothetical protein n=1 Tax=Burkholderia sp. TSV86 TaxID=1385594 RepID=UPI0018D2005F|nr:hypothetical protein [Burkholderia sp. TSV86]
MNNAQATISGAMKARMASGMGTMRDKDSIIASINPSCLRAQRLFGAYRGKSAKGGAPFQTASRL